MNLRLSTTGITLALCLAVTAARSQTPAPTPSPVPTSAPLTLAQVLDIARAKNPSLLSVEQHVDATKAAEITAGLRQNPSFTISGADITLPANNPTSPYSYAANVTRLFERGQKRRWRLDIAHATTDVTRSQYNDQVRQTVLQVKNAFTNMLVAKEALHIAQDNLDSYSKTVDLSQARLNAGDISKTDFERIDLQLAEFESDYDNAKLDLIQASDSLQLLMGIEKPIHHLRHHRQCPASGHHHHARPDRAGCARCAPRLSRGAAICNSGRCKCEAGRRRRHHRSHHRRRIRAHGNLQQRRISRFPFRCASSTAIRARRSALASKRSQPASLKSPRATRSSTTSIRPGLLTTPLLTWRSATTATTSMKRTRVRDNLEFSYRHGGTTLLDYLDALRDYRQVNLDALTANQQVWLSLHQLSFAAATEIVP